MFQNSDSRYYYLLYYYCIRSEIIHRECFSIGVSFGPGTHVENIFSNIMENIIPRRSRTKPILLNFK